MNDKKHCRNCNKLIPRNDEICPYCGASQTVLTRSKRNKDKNRMASPANFNRQSHKSRSRHYKKRHWYQRWYLWVIIILLVILAAFAWRGYSSQQNNSTPQSQTKSSSLSSPKQNATPANNQPEPPVIKKIQDKLSLFGVPRNAVSYDAENSEIRVSLPGDNPALNGNEVRGFVQKAITAVASTHPDLANVVIVNKDTGQTVLHVENGKVVNN